MNRLVRNPPPPGWFYCGGPDSDWLGSFELNPPPIPKDWKAWRLETPIIDTHLGSDLLGPLAGEY